MNRCELCSNPHPNEIWRGGGFYVIDASSESFPAYLRVVSERHVPDMSDLTDEERRVQWALLMCVERAMKETLRADKLNWAQFGNMVPHLHWHLTARWRDDAYYPDSPWGSPKRTVPADVTAERLARKDRLVAVLPALLDAALKQA